MNKAALTERPLNPEEHLIASYLAGSGFYGGLQLKNQLLKDDEKPDDDVLRIKLPKEKLLSMDKKSADQSQHSGLMGNLHGLLNTPATIALGGVAGFHHASKQYEDMEKEHLNKELAKAEKEYLDMLGQVKQSSEATPCVDAFVRGLVAVASSSPEDIEKEAKSDDDMADGSIHRMLGDAASPLAAPFRPAWDTAKGVTAGTTLASALGVYLLKQKMEGDKPKSAPHRIEIDPV